ncbi:AfsR/SARP family transcriptional regulator [Candidatus Leptofilum sp.]|uniref:AfsR/SARP family transcriptional regulator n=1 Tax=Candidatus Leptofilum sp. TaxID=3241576 RepID=UPI003B598888
MSQKELRISMLGGFELSWGDGQNQEIITNELPDKPRALLGYLVLNNRRHQRDTLATLFWPDSQVALASLRVALNKLKLAGLEQFLHISRNYLSFDQQSPYWFDVHAFQSLIANSRRQPEPNIAALKQAVSFYNGEFLAGFSLPSVTVFDEEILRLRQQLEQNAWNAFDTIIQASMLEKVDYGVGIQYAQRALTLMPWKEPAHRYLMWLLAHTGQKADAIKQYEYCREALKIHVDAEPSPETEELLLEIRQHKTTAELEIVTLPPLDVADREDEPPFLASGQRPFFVGRREPIMQLERALVRDKRPCWGLVGMGGVGKTTLALFLAHRLRAHFPDGVLWANMVESQPEEIATQWAAEYGYDLSLQRSGDERLTWLRQILAEKKALLIFDDVRSGAKIRRLLPESGDCAVLITSRTEQVVRSINAQPLALSQFALANGRRLLLHHIQDDRAINEPDAVDEICHLVGNLPLAINIAGSYLAYRPYRSLADFAELLKQRLAPHNLGEGDARLQETITLSWAHLDERQRCLFTLMSLFNGRTFSLEAIAALAEQMLDSREKQYQFEDQLQMLVQFSLLQDEGQRQYRQHNLLASFGLEKLTDVEDVQKRYSRYFANFAERNAANYKLLQRDWGNLDTAVHFAEKNQQWEDVLRFTAALKEAWFKRGRFDEARHAFELAFQAAGRLEEDTLLARNWLWWGQACLEQGDQTEARNWLQKALDLYDELEDGIGIADAEFELARLDIDQTLPEAAERRLNRVLALRREQNDDSGIAATKYRFARLWHRQLNEEKAKQEAEAALARQKAVGDELGRCRTLRLLVFIMIGLNQYDVAYSYAGEALALAYKLEDLGEIALAQKGMATAYRRLGQLEAASQAAAESFAALERMGDRRSMNDVRFLQCLIKRSEGKFQEAMLLAEECQREFSRLKDTLHVTYCLIHRGDFNKELGVLQTAVHHWQDALALAKKIGNETLIQKINDRLQADQPG